MKNISNEAFFALIDAKSIEEFLVTKELLNLRGKFNEKDSLELATAVVVNHKQDIADKLAKIGEFTIKKRFVANNYSQFIGRQKYINIGMNRFIHDDDKDEDKTI